MHVHNTADHQHAHTYFSGHELQNERRSWYVVALTAAMMVVQIACGLWLNSMALVAEGWHMATHVGAIGITALAYFLARREAHNPHFTFGTGKVGSLGAFTSAIILVVVSMLIFGESAARLLAPKPIGYNEALGVAVLGLMINLASAWLLGGGHHHGHTHHHGEHDHAHHHDHNLKAAYTHILADALISVLAISALLMGKYMGLAFMDPLTGIVGSFVIVSWAWSLLKNSGAMLLDRMPDAELASAIRQSVEADADNQVTDLHLWCVAPGKYSAIISLVSDNPRPPKHYKALLAFPALAHVTVEVNKCETT